VVAGSVDCKRCRDCGAEKPLSHFNKHGASKDRLSYYCRECNTKRRAQYSRSKNYRKTNLEYYYRNKEMWREIKARRRATEKQAGVSWKDTEWEVFAMKEIYSMASKRTKVTGVIHEVDHIVPLQSALVCGLHCSDNLQILTRLENRSKSNKHIV